MCFLAINNLSIYLCSFGSNGDNMSPTVLCLLNIPVIYISLTVLCLLKIPVIYISPTVLRLLNFPVIYISPTDLCLLNIPVINQTFKTKSQRIKFIKILI